MMSPRPISGSGDIGGFAQGLSMDFLQILRPQLKN
jgi:hypothetical protein